MANCCVKIAVIGLSFIECELEREPHVPKGLRLPSRLSLPIPLRGALNFAESGRGTPAPALCAIPFDSLRMQSLLVVGANCCHPKVSQLRLFNSNRSEPGGGTQMEHLQLVRVGIKLLEDGYTVEWTPWQEAASGSVTLPYPIYDSRLLAAMSGASRLVGQDFDYVNHVDEVKNLRVPEMTRDQLATFLTWVQRSERFCDGAIDSFVQDGRLLQALRRVVELEPRASNIA